MKKIIYSIILITTTSLLVVGCGNKTTLGKAHEESVTNGAGEEIGKRLVIESSGKDIKDKDIVKFYDETVKGNEYKYITVDFGNGEGLVFNDDESFIKGKIDENGMISSTEKLGQIKEDKVTYQKD